MRTKMALETFAGPAAQGDGSTGTKLRTSRTSELVVGDAHGRFFEAALRGTLFSDGMTATSISASTFATGDLSATAKPICGVHNPITSTVNLVILQATLSVVTTNATNTGPGVFVWAAGTAERAISTGTAPLNRRNLGTSGSQAKGMSGIALTGLVTALTVRHGSALQGGNPGNFSFVGTAAGPNAVVAGAAVENLDGSIIVPPGGVLGLFCTTQPVAHSAASSILWEEVAI